MKLIIDIPKEIVKAIQNGEDYRYDIHTAIAQGTSVSTEGELISREDLKKAIKSYADDQYAENEYLGECAIMTIIDKAPTVVNEYTKGFTDGERSGRNFPLTDEEKAILVRQWQPQGEWVGINEYLKHIEETTGEKYKTSGLYNGRLFCNRCWKMSELMIKTKFCYECGARMEN